MTTMNHQEPFAYYLQHKERILQEWEEFLRFESISTEPAYSGKCRECAEWLCRHLGSLGFQAHLIETPSKPVVYATREYSAHGPHLSFYGHYDVQPVDPLELWESSPFVPQWRNGRLYARGAQDNKGQLFFFVKGLEALQATGQLKGRVSIFIEGEEECGSEGLHAVLPNLGRELESDVLLVCDTGCEALSRPAITLGLRGIVRLTISLGGLLRDLHSGAHGGMAPNPATELARLVASFHNPDGSIAVEGIYDGTETVDERDVAIATAQEFDVAQYRAVIGVEPVGGEARRFPPVVRRGFRPTVEINGLHSGYSGPGSKTIIPATAFAKVTSRLVASQDPAHVLQCIEAHVRKHAPAGLRLDISEQGIGGPALLVSSATAPVRVAAEVLHSLRGTCEYLWEGGSIPVVTEMAQRAKATPLLVGFGLEEDNVHAPNESFSLEQFELGVRFVTELVPKL